MSNDKKYFTVVYEWKPDFKDNNPLSTETPWGLAKVLATGDLTEQLDLLEETLQEIESAGYTSSLNSGGMAEDALNKLMKLRAGS